MWFTDTEDALCGEYKYCRTRKISAQNQEISLIDKPFAPLEFEEFMTVY